MCPVVVYACANDTSEKSVERKSAICHKPSRRGKFTV